MGSDSVIACAVRPQPGAEYGVDHYFNKGGIGKGSNIYDPPNYALSNGFSSIEDGNLYCSYTLEPEYTLNSQYLNLEQNQFHILLATGMVDHNGEVRKHSKKAASADVFHLPDNKSK